MSKLVEFVKTTAIGGLVVIVPFAVLIFALNQVLQTLIALTGSAANALPFATLADTKMVLVVAVVGVIALCFVTGLLLRTRVGAAVKKWLERNIAERIPMYAMIRSLTQRFAGIKGVEFAPAEIDLYGSSARVLGFVVETLPNDHCSVFVPVAPAVTIGQIYILPQTNVHPLDAPVSEVVNSITQWGVGAKRLYKESI